MYSTIRFVPAESDDRNSDYRCNPYDHYDADTNNLSDHL